MHRRLFLRVAALGPVAAVAAMVSHKVAQTGVVQKITPVLRVPWHGDLSIGKVLRLPSGPVGNLQPGHAVGSNGGVHLSGYVQNGKVSISRLTVETWNGFKKMMDKPAPPISVGGKPLPGVEISPGYIYHQAVGPVTRVIEDLTPLFSFREGAVLTTRVVGDKLTIFVDGVARWSAILAK